MAKNQIQLTMNGEDAFPNTKQDILKINTSAIAANSNTGQQTVLDYTMQEYGVYIIYAEANINYYGSEGRDLFLRLLIDNIIVSQTDGVCNSYIWTLTRHILWVGIVNAGKKVKVTVENTVAGKMFALPAFTLNMVKLN